MRPIRHTDTLLNARSWVSTVLIIPTSVYGCWPPPRAPPLFSDRGEKWLSEYSIAIVPPWKENRTRNLTERLMRNPHRESNRPPLWSIGVTPHTTRSPAASIIVIRENKKPFARFFERGPFVGSTRRNWNCARTKNFGIPRGTSPYPQIADHPILDVKRQPENGWQAVSIRQSLRGSVRSACDQDETVARLADFPRHEHSSCLRGSADADILSHSSLLVGVTSCRSLATQGTDGPLTLSGST
jgi:hypothetical protein